MYYVCFYRFTDEGGHEVRFAEIERINKLVNLATVVRKRPTMYSMVACGTRKEAEQIKANNQL